MGGIGSLINSVLGGSSSARKQNKYSKAQQKYQFELDKKLAGINQKYALQSMQRQYELERTAALNAHQWEISDLEKAGLNPILSMGGSGAGADVGLTSGSASGVGTGNGASPQAGSIIDAMNSASMIARTFKEIGLMGAQEKNIDKDTKLKGEEIKTEKTKQDKNKADAGKAGAETITEKYRPQLILMQGLNEEQKKTAQELENKITTKDVQMLEKFGVTRRELVSIGTNLVGYATDLIKGGMYAKAAKIFKHGKGNKI